MELSIVIPVYNEQDRINEKLPEIITFCKNNIEKYEIIFVNDGSTDQTETAIETIAFQEKIDIRLITLSKNMGKGYAVKTGMLEATNRYILFMDIDLSTPLAEAIRFSTLLDWSGADIIIGSRNLRDSRVRRENLIRGALGKLFPFITNHILDLNITDTQCGFKMFRNQAARQVFSKQTINRWGFDAEILYIARKQNLLIKEIGVTWNNDSRSKVNLLTAPIQMIKELFEIKRRHAK